MLAGSATQIGPYEIDQSIRFNDNDSARLARTVSSSGSLTTWTTSVWVKRGKYTVNTNSQWFPVFSASDGSTTYDAPLNFNDVSTGGAFNVDIGGYSWRTSALARDTSAWYHVVTVWDSNNGTTADRMRLYINGERVTDFASSASPSSGANSRWNSSSYSHHRIGNLRYSGAETTFVFDGYLAEINFIDGTALDPTSLGETNSDTGQWVPIKYTGSYGTNGFYIDGATSTFLGKDAKATSAAVTNKASTSSEWGGTTGAYTFDTNEIDRSSTVNAIISSDLLSGDFSFDFTLTTSGGAVRIGVIDDQDSPTFNGTGDDGGMDSMTNSFYLDKGNNQFRYGGSSQGSASGVANGSAVTIERTGSTIKITDDGSDAHTFSQTFSGPVRVVISGGGSAFNLDNVQYTADGASGNDNSYFSSGLAAADQMSDSPTNNQATLNPLFTGAALSDGNLVATASGNSYQRAFSTFAIDDGGKHVCEFQKSSGTFGLIGIMQNGNHTNTTGNSNMYGYNLGTGEVFKGNPTASVLTDLGTGAANSLMRIEYDGSNDTIKIFDDGTEIFPASTGVSNTVGLTGHNSLHFGCAPYASGTIITATFSPLSGTPTTGFKELTAPNLPDPTIADPSDHFNTVLYTGNGATGQSITGVGFQPDWTWTKIRSPNAYSHQLFDAVRGAGKNLQSNNTNAEGDLTSEFTSFDSDGFTIDDVNQNVNENSSTYVSWNWKANGSGSSNEDGSITSTVSANTTSGFSIVTYTGTGANATVGHGLGAVPKMIIIKDRSNAESWIVYHEAVGNDGNLYLNLTNGKATQAIFNNTTPTSSVFSLGSIDGANKSSANHVAYCFADVEGFSKFGSYTGNASADGPFIYTGFKPRWIMFKSTSSGQRWYILDVDRAAVPDANTVNTQIFAELSNTESAPDTGSSTDFLSNGFKVRNTGINGSGQTITYMAFAESPFKTATAR